MGQLEHLRREFIKIFRNNLIEVYPIFNENEVIFLTKKEDLKRIIEQLSGYRFKCYLLFKNHWDERRTVLWPDSPFGLEFSFINTVFQELKNFEAEDLKNLISSKFKLFETERIILKAELLSKGFQEQHITDTLESIDDDFDLSFNDIYESKDLTPIQYIEQEFEQKINQYRQDVKQQIYRFETPIT